MILDGQYMTTDGQTDVCSRKYAVLRGSMKLELIILNNGHWIESLVIVTIVNIYMRKEIMNG